MTHIIIGRYMSTGDVFYSCTEAGRTSVPLFFVEGDRTTRIFACFFSCREIIKYPV